MDSIGFAANLTSGVSSWQYSQRVARAYGISHSGVVQEENSLSHFFFGLKQAICQAAFAEARDDITSAYRKLIQDIAAHYLSIDEKNWKDSGTLSFTVTLKGNDEQFSVEQTLLQNGLFNVKFGFVDQIETQCELTTCDPSYFIKPLLVAAELDKYFDRVGALGMLNKRHVEHNKGHHWMVKEEAFIPAVDLLNNISPEHFNEEVDSMRVYSNLPPARALQIAYTRNIAVDGNVRIDDGVNREVVGCECIQTPPSEKDWTVCILQKTTIASYGFTVRGVQTVFNQSRPYLFSIAGSRSDIQLYEGFASQFISTAVRNIRAHKGNVNRVIFVAPSIPPECSLEKGFDFAKDSGWSRSIMGFGFIINRFIVQDLKLPVFFSDEFGFEATSVTLNGVKQLPWLGRSKSPNIKTRYFRHEHFWRALKQQVSTLMPVNERQSQFGQFQILDTDMIVRFEHPLSLVGNSLGHDIVSDMGQLLSASTAHAVHARRCRQYHQSVSKS